MNIILIGAQGAGKGTQAKRLVEILGMRSLASGELFRKAVSEKTEFGRHISVFLEQGKLVPDALTVGMMLDLLRETGYEQGVLLDGFPRTIVQAQALDRGLQALGKKIDAALYLNVPREELLNRLSGRYLCQTCQHVYHLHTSPPRMQGVCDLDGGALFQRSDDTEEAIQKRLEIFFNETMGVLEYYRVQRKLLEVNGNQSIEQVQMDLLCKLQTFLPASG